MNWNEAIQQMNDKPPINEKTADMVRYHQAVNRVTHADILRSVRRLAGRRVKGRANWALAMDVWGVGSTFARILCHEAGIVPEATE